MESKNLATIWSRPDSSRLVPKQISVRLPVHVMARIRALEEMFPTRTRTEIIGDLLSAALDEMASGLQAHKGQCIGPQDPRSNELYYEVEGPSAEFHSLANKHFIELERELGNENAKPLFDYGLIAPASDFAPDA